MSAQVIRADARHLPLADSSVDLIITSPPYWALRSYTDGGEHYDGQIGSEASPTQFVNALIDCTREMVRVLKPSGSLWVNLGDKYCSPGGHTDNCASTRLQGRPNLRKQGRPDRSTTGHTVKPKSLFGLPWRYAIRCIDDLGLILRAEVIWDKPNGLPESVTDRVRRSHEQWFHFTREPRYYSAVDEIRDEPSDYHREAHSNRGRRGSTSNPRAMLDTCNPLGKLPGSVWEIPTQPLAAPEHLGVDHFAAFPMEWPRRIIRGWSPAGICTACGEGRRPVVEVAQQPYRSAGSTGRPKRQALTGNHGKGANGVGYPQTVSSAVIVGESCACPEPTAPARPAVVLDPFGGTGTTALVADVLGRHGISVDMSADYCRLAAWRTADPGERARALQVEKPPAVLDGQMDLLDLIGEAAS